MKKRLANVLKYCKGINVLYCYLFSIIVNFIKIFVKPNSHLILFNSFGGAKFDDSPKEIFESIRKDARFHDYSLVWAFHNPSKYNVDGAEKIKTDTLKYFIMALKARVWVTNSSMERGLNFKGKKTFYFNTWHGTPMKFMGTDLLNASGSYKGRGDSRIDIMTSQSEYETKIYSRAFGLDTGRILQCGLPRNDWLAKYTIDEKKAIKQKLKIPLNKKVILYAPTFRDFEKDNEYGCVFVPPIHMGQWKEELGKNYVLLFRTHYEVTKAMKIKGDDFVIDMTEYPLLNELIIVADILISDYSSIFFDFSITGKPMFHFTYDYEEYEKKRGLYFDIRNFISGSDNEEDVIRIIKSMNVGEESAKTCAFRGKYVKYYGDATRQSVDYIAKTLKENL